MDSVAGGFGGQYDHARGQTLGCKFGVTAVNPFRPGKERGLAW